MRKQGSISVFLALSIVLIISLMLVCLEGARHAAADEYSGILLKSATDSVLAEYYRPLFDDYHILALDTGFGSKTGTTEEIEKKLRRYTGKNVWNFSLENISVTDTKPLFAEEGNIFLEQAAEYEKYTAASSVADEIIGRVKALGDQKKITKVLERRMDIEDKLSVIDGYTLDLMRLIDGVDINSKAKKSSSQIYTIKNYFIKRLFIKEVNQTTAAINNPAVYEKLKSRYENPIEEFDALYDNLPGYANTVKKRMDCEAEIVEIEGQLSTVRMKRTEAEAELKSAESRISEIEKEKAAVNAEIDLINQDSEKQAAKEKEAETDKKETDETKADHKEASETIADEKEKQRLEEELRTRQDRIAALDKEKEDLLKKADLERADISSCIEKENNYEKQLSPLRSRLSELQISEKRQRLVCEGKASALYALCSNVKTELAEVISIIEKVGKKQAETRALVEGYESLVESVAPILTDEIKNGLEDSLDLMKAYVGLDNRKADVIDFDGILLTAGADSELMSQIDEKLFIMPSERNYTTIMAMYDAIGGIGGKFRDFKYDKFVFDYSGIKEHIVENELEAEFEKNVSKGYMSLFLDDSSVISNEKLVTELLPSLWFETGGDRAADADKLTKGAGDKSGKELLSGTDEESGITEIGELFENGTDALGTKLMSAMYMLDHFKSFSEYSSVGDTVLNYELEYILSGCESDSANLSAAATKILLLRMLVSTIYTMTDKDLKMQAEAVAMATMGFTGLPFLVTIVKYLILFLWATAQAVIETSAILRGKKVPVITSSESFCLSLPELAIFPTLISKKAEEFAESELYLDYNNYIFVLLLLQGGRKQASRAMDLIQENIRYRYDDDFLLNNAIVGFSASAEFSALPRFTSVLAEKAEDNGVRLYRYNVTDTVCY